MYFTTSFVILKASSKTNGIKSSIVEQKDICQISQLNLKVAGKELGIGYNRDHDKKSQNCMAERA